MHAYAVPAIHQVAPTETALDSLLRQAEDNPEHVGFTSFEGSSWQEVTYTEFLTRARRLAHGLIDAGIEAGDRVALMSRTRLEWALCDYAIWLVAGVTVPIYETSSAEQVEWILSDSEAVAIVIEDAEHAALVAAVAARTPLLRATWQIDDGSLDDLEERGRNGHDDRLSERRALLGSAVLATITYTSGTTGRPKGCAITHGNLVAVYSNTREAPGIPEIFNNEASTVLFLPLAHCLARIIQLSCVNAGVCIAYGPDVKHLAEHLQSFRPTLLLSVPRVFEKLYNTARHQAHSRHQGRLFDRADEVAVRYSQAMDTGHPGLSLRIEHQVFEQLVYRKIRAAMGGRIRWSVSGGAPLGARLGHFFRGAGVTVLEGYGLSESTTGGTLNLPGRQKVGSVGPPVPGCEVRVAHDGELLLRAEFVMPGYWHNDVATKEVLDDDGWMHTGDIGEIDDDGFVFITGRKKELLVTSGGKNVAPAVLEDRLRAAELVSECMVVGDARPYVACLVTLDRDALGQWASEHGHDARASVADLRADPELNAAVQQAVDEANAAVSRAEGIRRWEVLDEDFTEAAGELTPTLKLKRHVIMERYRQEVEALYGSPN